MRGGGDAEVVPQELRTVQVSTIFVVAPMKLADLSTTDEYKISPQYVFEKVASSESKPDSHSTGSTHTDGNELANIAAAVKPIGLPVCALVTSIRHSKQHQQQH